MDFDQRSEFKIVFWERDGQAAVKLGRIKNDLARHALLGDGVSRLHFPAGANFAVVYPRGIDGDQHGEIIRIKGLACASIGANAGDKKEVVVRFDRAQPDAIARLVEALDGAAQKIGCDVELNSGVRLRA